MIYTNLLTYFLVFTAVSTVATMAFSGSLSLVYFLTTLSICSFVGLVFVLLLEETNW